jgi:murein DD-endopeptidase MepM/ murein hydrolase activator NlpD
MDKKVKFSEQPTRVKILYAAVVAVLCITAIIVGIVSVANKKDESPEPTPPSDGAAPDIGDGEGGAGTDDGEGSGTPEPDKLSFVSPLVGTVAKFHSSDAPVFSETLEEWRIHKGVDIMAAEGAEVFSSAAGTVTKIYSDPLLGRSVEVTHDGGIVTVYSNLCSDGIAVKEGDAIGSGALIGVIGDSAITELADEAHLHFEMKVNGVSVNPLDYLTKESLGSSLGITEL